MGTKRRELPDGSFLIETDDGDPHLAEARAKDLALVREAVEAVRSRGIARPVLVQLANGWRVLTPDQARALLVGPFQVNRRVARDGTGRGQWPDGYWFVEAVGGQLRVYESRFPENADRQ